MVQNNTRDSVAENITRRTALKMAGATAGYLALGQATAAVPTPRLHTDGKWLKDPAGNNVKLRGVATADPGFYSRSWHPKDPVDVAKWASDDRRGWYPSIVRLPCTQSSVEHFGGIDTFVEDILRPVVDALAAQDVYALVDFHLIRPYTPEATQTYNQENDSDLAPIDDVMRNFWNRVAPEFAGDTHVLYELFNEPTLPAYWGNDEKAWKTWRTAAQPWVDLVQRHAPETPLIIGSPRWTSVTNMAPVYPFEGNNLIYSGHIYPANGPPSGFDDTYGAPAEEVPVMITEFGWDPNGGSVDKGTTSGWGSSFREWVESYENMGWMGWCFDDSWAPTFFDSPNEGVGIPWTLKDAPEEQGWYIKQWLEETKNDMIPESTIDDSMAPPMPANLSLTRASEISVEISWDAVTDAGEAGLSHYNVYLDGTIHTEVVAGTTTATVTGLDPSSTYEVGVSAVDAADNESSVATIVVETRASDAGQSAFNGPHVLPGRIQAEDFDTGGQGLSYYDTSAENEAGASYRDADVDIGTAASTGNNVGYITGGEWLEYSVQVESAGTYEITVNVASGSTQGGNLRVEVDQEEVASTNVWPTGGWSSWTQIRVGSADLSPGEHIVRVVAESSGWNFDWIEFTGGGNGGSSDTSAPTLPSNLTVTDTTETSVDLDWSGASDAGSGLDHYTIYVDGSQAQTVSAGTTQATVTGLSPNTTYDIGIRAVDGAGNASAMVTVSATTDAAGDGEEESDPPSQALVVNDYDGSPAWPGRNDLGDWCGAGSFENGSGVVQDGALVLEYDNGGWFAEQVQQDVSEYSRLVFRLRGANGGEEDDILFDMDGVRTMLSNVTDSTITTSYSTVAIDLAAAGIDTASPSALRLNFWQGGDSTLSIEKIWLE
jgi:endoglucanase